MKILVTGAKGFVGKNLCATLYNIRDGKDRTRPGLKIEEVFEYDLDSSPEELDAWCRDCDFVFNLAGVNRPQNAEEFMLGNFGFASTLLDTLKKHGNRCPVMLSSSQQASLTGRFGNSEYGRSKKAGEDLFLEYERDFLKANTDLTDKPDNIAPVNSELLKDKTDNIASVNSEFLADKPGNIKSVQSVQSVVNNNGRLPRVLIYRFPNLFGKWCRPNYNSAVATFCNNIANDLPITVNDPSVELELLYIDDLVTELLDALEGHEHRCEFDGLAVVPSPSEAPALESPAALPHQQAASVGCPAVLPHQQAASVGSPAVLPHQQAASVGCPAVLPQGRYCYCPITHRATLGHIVDLLHQFADQPRTLLIPEIPLNSFAKKLYSTYLSYLPASKVSFPLRMNVDDRGSFTELIHTLNSGQVSINISKPGITKGQHWHHTKWEFFIVVAGHGLIQERKIGSDEVIEFEVSGDKIEAVHMLPGYTHNIINLSDTENLVTVMYANELFDPNHPDTFFEKV